MNSLIKTFKASGRAAVIALALGSTAMVAAPAPAMAQSFSFQFGNDNFSFGIGSNNDGVRFRRLCLTDRQIRRGLRDEGWEDIRFIDRDGNWVRVVARWDENDRYYTMRINRCTGKVRDIERVRSRRGPGGNFTLELHF
jgi:hypothetical protein